MRSVTSGPSGARVWLEPSVSSRPHLRLLCAAGARLGRPGGPLGLGLFPASIPEAGLLRALLWPGIALIVFGRACIGGAVMTRISACHRGIAAVG
jgi:hypothetical protein